MATDESGLGSGESGDEIDGGEREKGPRDATVSVVQKMAGSDRARQY